MNSAETPYILSESARKGLPWVAAVAMFMQTLDATILNTALPAMAKSMERSPLAMQAAVVSYALTVALLIPVSGWLADRFGTRRIFIFAVALFMLGSLACALSPTLPLLVVSRILQGAGGAMMMPVARLSLIRAFPRAEMLAIMSFVTMPGLVGPVVGPLLGGWLVDVASWHWVFLINLPIGAFGIWYGKRIMPNFTMNIGKLDWKGMALFGLGLALLSLGVELSGEGVGRWYWNALLLLTGISLLWRYLRHAEQHEAPLIDLNLLRIRTLHIGTSGSLVARLGTGGIPLLLPLMLQVAFGYPALTAGLMMAPVAIAAVCVKALVTPLINRFGYRRVLVCNTFLLALSTATFALATPKMPLSWMVPLLLAYGAINSIQLSAMNTLAIADLKPEHASMGNGLIAIAQQLSIGFGISLSAMLLRGVRDADWLSGGNLDIAFRITFVLLGILTALSTWLFFKLKDDDGAAMTRNQAPSGTR